MTFCFAFIAPGDGIGIISDTRVTWRTAYGDWEIGADKVQKVWNPNRQCFFAMAGSKTLLSALLSGISDLFTSMPDRGWYQSVQNELPKRYLNLLKDSEFRTSEHNAQIIYGSVRHKRSSQIFNLSDYHFSYKDGASYLGHNFGKVDHVAIGATREIRKRLTEAAILNMQELYSRKGNIKILEGHEKEELAAKLKIEGDATFMIMDTRPGAGAPFPRMMRSMGQELFGQWPAAIKPTGAFLIGTAALKAIEQEMEQIRLEGQPYSETIGTDWQLSVLNLKDGFTINDTTTQPFST
ncbi:hypothetical protein FBZ85_1462 [Azospirillum brasilense]|uniref:hypothetical protein n=1 Tax=Azospirillum baldaniorum TaxID=1064539 RepID=UPI001013D330|nr:hypothetical protein [Azospirillum baldaniorum]TWA66979.1 hypothetical protein FBZ85_1462 [Azospirillum brasilense]